MAMLRVLSASEQVAEHLRHEIARGIWNETMPGSSQLVKELGVGRNTVDMALLLLEKEGLLLPQGIGRRRLIVASSKKKTNLRIRIMLYQKSGRKVHYLVELAQLLREAGHDAAFTDKTLCDLSMDVEKVGRFVESTKADAWVVASGSRDILDWFATQSKPTFALFGRLVNSSLASTSPKRAPVYIKLVERLVDLGHRKIVHLSRQERRQPTPGFLEQLFLDELEKYGIRTSSAYNLPDWKETGTGLRDLLDSLFNYTPPTALIIDGAMEFSATRNHLARKGILAPEQISLICTDPDPMFEWDIPAVTHMAWTHQRLIRQVLKWANSISHGKDDRRKSVIDVELVSGGTMGPVPKPWK